MNNQQEVFSICAGQYAFRSYRDLVRDCKSWAQRLRGSISAVSGIPRSGIPVASILAQELHIPLVSIETLIHGDISHWRPSNSKSLSHSHGPILLVDDSVSTGRTMRIVREKLKDCSHILFGSLYIVEESEHLVDLKGFDIQKGHFFEWTLFRGTGATHFCIDFDGVLCHDWTDNEQEVPEQYSDHLKHADPLAVISQDVGIIVTARLERYRSETETWLEHHGISYRELIMSHFESVEMRDQYGHARWKAEVYQQCTHQSVFVESSRTQAKQIHELTGKQTLCYETMELFG